MNRPKSTTSVPLREDEWVSIVRTDPFCPSQKSPKHVSGVMRAENISYQHVRPYRRFRLMRNHESPKANTGIPMKQLVQSRR